MKQRNKIMGYSSQKNKVKRNPFDLSHRNMFTAQIGELLPVLCQWVNPNETFKLGFNGLTRTASLQTAAFTRLRENVQYYFVPFYALWRWFPEVYRNMPVGAAGQNITKIAQSSSESTQIGSKLPVFNLSDIKDVLYTLYNLSLNAVSSWLSSVSTSEKRLQLTVVDFYNYCESDPKSASYISWHNKVFYYNSYRLCRVAKLLQMLGYGNYSVIQQYDIAAQALKYVKDNKGVWSQNSFSSNPVYSLVFSGSLSTQLVNQPDLSVFPLLAYHKVCQDHYKLRQWQPFEPYCCNIDYLSPTSNLKGLSWFNKNVFSSSPNQTSLFDLEQSNLPIDYLLGVLPTAQYGSESSIPLSSGSGALEGYTDYLQPSDMGDDTESAGLVNIDDQVAQPSTNDTVLVKSGGGFTRSGSSDDAYNIYNPHRHHVNIELGQQISTNLAISTLRNLYALQKYKEIQASNDADYIDQVLAHWGIKPQTDKRTSVFISGGDKTISINPQVNQNLSGDSEPEIKAIGVSDLSAGAKFTVKDPGLIIGIYRCVPTLDYAQTGIDRNLFKSDVSDFPLPEFDSVGMQTQYRCEVSSPLLGLNTSLSTVSASPQPFDYAKTYGYAPRYAELKTSYDRFNGGFLGAFSSWVTGLDAKALSVFYKNYGTSSSNFMYQISELLSVRPSLCYPIFVNQWSGTVNDDKLLIGSVNTVKAVRPFSVYGLPWSK